MVRQLRLLAVLLAGLNLGSLANAGTILFGVPDDSYLNLGASSQYDSVGRFTGTTDSSSFSASGTLIAPDWVLTAAHVVDHATSLTFSVGGQSYSANSWTTYPAWKGELSAGNDIALVHLSRASNIQPAMRYTGNAELSQLTTSVGYGMTGNGQTGATRLDGAKRAEQNRIDQLANPRLLLSTFDDPLHSGRATALEGLIAPGDSGGGMFITTPSGTFLAGVNSFIGATDGKADASYGDVEGQTRVSAFNAWIDSVLSGLYNPGTALFGDGPGLGVPLVATIPEPASVTMLLLGGLTLLLVRRRR